MRLRTTRTTGALGLLLGGVLVSAAALVPAWPAHSAPATADAPHDAEHLLVGFRPGASAAAQDRALHDAGATRQRAIGKAVLAHVPPGQVARAVDRLRQDASVRYAEPDWIGHVAATPSDPSFGQQWSLANTGQTVNGIAGTAGEDIGARQAWDVTTGSASVVVGVVDTGVDYTHPDLAANVWNNPGGINGCAAGTHGYNVLASTCDPRDDDTAYGGHGSHVAGIISAVGNNGTGVTGVGWRTTVLPVKTVDSSGNGTTSALLTGLDWLLRAKQAGVNVRVINDSQTWKGTAYSQALRDEIALLGTNGILFVSAGGNTAEDNDDPSLRRWPCGYVTSSSVCAAATTSTGVLASYANRGATTVDLGAPGDNIYSTLRNGTYGFVSGSSMAAAQVSGAAALLLAQQDRTPFELKQSLLTGAAVKSSLAGKVRTGARLDVCGAMPGCGTAPPPGTTGTAGTTTVGAQVDTMSADRKRVNRVALPVAGQVTKLSMYLAPTGTSGTQRITGLVYADAGGRPGALVARTGELLFSSTQAAGWYDLTFSSPVALTAGTYWIGIASGATGGVTGFRWTSVSGSRAWNSASYTAGPSDPFGTATVDSEQMSLYATYTTTPASPPPPAPFAVTPPVTNAGLSGGAVPAPRSGSVVTTTDGDWANGPGTVSYQWRRCSSAGASCQAIAGATGSSYTPTAADVGSTLQSVVTATTSAGSTASASPPSFVVLAGTTPSPTPTTSPTTSPSPTPSPTLSPTPPPTTSPPAVCPAWSTLGQTTVGSSTDRFTQNRKRATGITVDQAGHLDRLNAYLEPTGSKGTQVLLGVLYADDGGSPGALVATTSELTFSATQPGAWYQLPFPTPVSVDAGRYWIGVLSGRSTGVAGFRWTGQTGCRAWNNDAYDDGPSPTFGTYTTDNELMSLFATWSP